jgi:hypothetical protein
MTRTAFMRMTPVHSTTGRRSKQPNSALAFVTVSPQNREQMIVWVEPEGLDNLKLSRHRMLETVEELEKKQSAVSMCSVKETKA